MAPAVRYYKEEEKELLLGGDKAGNLRGKTASAEAEGLSHSFSHSFIHRFLCLVIRHTLPRTYSMAGGLGA